MSNKTYDLLKNIALLLPVIITLIVAILQIWNIPYKTEIELTLLAIESALASIVKIENKIYNKKLKEKR